ncbi:MAG: glycosyltransferase, partial [Proteobacteria bacterium]|nr:glycosyltransferase [Pseudomonadota bacterium]
MDVNPHVVACAQALAAADAEHPENLTFKAVEPEWIEHTRTKFDLVLCQEMLEHLEEPWAMADLLERPVKKGGRVIVTVPIDFWDSEAHRTDGLFAPEHLWNFERRDVLDMLGHKSGFEHAVIALDKPLRIDADKRRGHHFVTFKPGGPPAREIDWARKLAVQNPRQTLSVCLITKDAEDQLHRTLKSVRAFADEIIVADTGSQDSTLDIARRHRARIVNLRSIEPGAFGFDDARNASIQTATGDWVLWIDADEVILGPDKLAKYLRPNVFHGYALPQHHFSADPPEAAKIDLPVRLFRNFQGIRFFGKIHEHPETGLNQSVVPTMLLPDVNLGHDGYLDEAARRGRFQRNLAFLKWDRQVNPDRVLGWFFELRDYWNAARFELERTGGLVNEKVRLAAEKVISIYREKFLARGQTHMHTDGLKFYSQCNRILRQGFEARVACHLQSPGGAAGFDTAPKGGGDGVRFATVADFEAYMNQQVRASLAQISRRWA